jgi:two-component system, NtrC family, nitrogen regulation sensor histidine kinase NtrY
MLKTPDLHIPQRLRALSGWVAFGLVVLGIVTGLLTFLVLTGSTPISPTENVVRWLLFANAALVLTMAGLVASQVAVLWRAMRRGVPGSGLHLRLISLFSLIATLPAILVAVFASVTLDRGLDSWFSERTQAIVNTATNVAEAYVTNAAESTRADTANISADLIQQRDLFDKDRPTFVRRLARHVAIRNLAAAFVADMKTDEIAINVSASDTIKFIAPPPDAKQLLERGELLLFAPGRGGNLVRTLIKLQNYPNHYLYVYRVVNPAVIDQLIKTQDAKAEYDALLKQRSGAQLAFALVYALLTLVFLLAAIWTGLWFADRLVSPLVRLLGAAREVAAGNLDTKVSTKEGHNDLRNLSQTFNLMTDQIRYQRDALVQTNEQLDRRRRFTEAMLSGVSSGVIGINQDHHISLLNRSAQNLLRVSDRELIGKPLGSINKDFADLFDLARSRPSGASEGKVDAEINGQQVSFVVRITTEKSENEDHGFVLTFDDITELVSAQRNSAWSDIARRIAHEIKNPLTPIQLSAERLKRKYLKEITTDKLVFEQCTDTIIRQVGDLGRIVDEFSSFARMPKALPEPNSLQDTVRDSTVLQRVSSSDIEIELDMSSEDVIFEFDRRLITQAITNLIKNAREAIEPRIAADPQHAGRITVEAGNSDLGPFIRVSDNGVGLPNANRHRLAEPYMTTREKGTGLGLAIVKRIMEEHGGSLLLTDAPGGQGARITLQFQPQATSQPVYSEA